MSPCKLLNFRQFQFEMKKVISFCSLPEDCGGKIRGASIPSFNPRGVLER